MAVKSASLSGFPEWMPGERLLEQHVIDRLRITFELWGYAPIETRAVEPMEQLLRKGEIDKEVYVLRRLQADPNDPGDSGLALHYDLTVPFARYVVERSGHLNFPFKRYQIQKCWRGERPQEGRYREFTQADIDVIGDGDLPFHFDAELPVVVADALRGLPLPQVRMQVNNRKLSQGFFRGVGFEDLAGVLRIVDKIDKIGPAKVAELLQTELNASPAQTKAVLEFAAIQVSDDSLADRVAALGISDPLMDEGLAELLAVVSAAAEHAPGFLVADLKIARGLDYYTGTVYETLIVGHEKLGSICSGGRYDNLASSGSKRYPGVGISFGVTRLMSRVFAEGSTQVSRTVPTCVVVALAAEEGRAAAARVAAGFRARGIPAEVSPSADKYGKQIRYAERRGIPFVWFGPEATASGVAEVRDLRTREQIPADPGSWQPDEQDVRPAITSAIGS